MTPSQLSPVGRFEKILVASDGSEFTASAEQIALGLAQKSGARITVMRMVMSNPEYDVLAPEVVARQEMDTYASLLGLKAQAEKLGVTCEPLVTHGIYPHDDILEAADRVGADLIVMGRRGRRGLARLMVGDATARVVAQARCQVLVAPRQTALWSKRIMLATDGSRYSDGAAVSACNLAKLTGVPLLVMTACAKTASEALCQEAEAIVSRVLQHARQAGIPAEPAIVEGPPVQAILEGIARHGVDLLVGGSHGRTGMGKVFLGSVMERVIGQATCPVLTVKG